MTLRQIIALIVSLSLTWSSIASAAEERLVPFSLPDGSTVNFTPFETGAVAKQPDDVPLVQDAMLEAISGTIISRLLENHPGSVPRRIKFVLIHSGRVNCSAFLSELAIGCTDETVRLLMKAGSRGEDQLAFLLAHEIAHLTITSHQPKLSQVPRLAVVPSADRLTSKPKKKSAAADALATAASSRILSAFAAPDWTRAQEDQADGLALVLMNRAGYDPYAAAQFLGTFDQAIKAAKARAEVNRLTDFVDAGLGAAAAFIFADKKSKMDAKLVLLFSAFLLAEVAKELVKSHYHRSPAERAERCAQEAADLVGKGDDLEEQRLFARLEIDFPDIRNPAIPEAPTSLWDSFLVSGTQPMLDLAVSEDIDLGLMLKVDLDPRNICPASITSFQLALSCGQLYAQHGDRTKAVLLSDQALNDPLATADTYRRAAQIHGSLGDDAGAIAILQRGGARFSDGRLLPDQVLIFHRTGNVEGTRAAFDSCYRSSSVEVQAVCSGLQKMLQRPTAKPT